MYHTSSMDVSFDSWKRSRMSVTSVDDSSPMYEVDCHHWKQKLVFSTNGQEFASTKLSCYKMSFDADIRDQSIPVKSDKTWTIQRSYMSPAFGQPIVWKSSRRLSRLEFICFDANKNPLAKFTTRNGWKKIGTIEFAEEFNPTQEQKDEVVVVGLTLAFQIIQSMTAASSASSASAASSSAVAAAVA